MWKKVIGCHFLSSKFHFEFSSCLKCNYLQKSLRRNIPFLNERKKGIHLKVSCEKQPWEVNITHLKGILSITKRRVISFDQIFRFNNSHLKLYVLNKQLNWTGNWIWSLWVFSPLFSHRIKNTSNYLVCHWI